MQPRLYHMGFRCSQISRNTLANANQQRDWRIYADLAEGLTRLSQFRPVFREFEAFGIRKR
jgi:hypothetical protein